MHPNRMAELEGCQNFALTFAERVQRIARHVPDASPSERQLIHDYSRGARRYQHRALQRVLALAARCTDPADAASLEELIRSYRLSAQRAMPPLSLDEAFAAETEAQAHADIAQWRFMRSRCVGTAEIVTRALGKQLVFTRSALDAVYMYPTAA